MASPGFNWQGYLLRLLFALLLVFTSYNPEGYSYYHWMIANPQEFTPLKLLAGVVLLIGWAIYIRATLRSLGPIGLTLAAAFFGSLVWVVLDLGWVSTDSMRALSYLVLLMLSAVLSVGISWSLIRRRITGQLDVDQVDE